MSLITSYNAAFSYDGVVVVSELNFKIEEGDYVCIVGDNGAGKSTLISGLLKLKKPAQGSIDFGGSLNKNMIGYLPQSTTIKNDFPASVYEVVISGTLNQQSLLPFYTKKQKAIANTNLEKLGILNLKNRPFSELSGGQQQRVLLARGLCATKKVLLLDEPAAGLDPLITKEFYQLVKDLNNEGITIIMVSHDINFALKDANKILHLKNKQRFFGSVADYLKSDVGKLFLGVENVNN